MHNHALFREANPVVIEYGALLDDDGLRDHLLSVQYDPDYIPGMTISLSAHPESSGDGRRPRALAKLLPRPGHEGAPPNLAAVVTDTRLGVGLTRLYGAHAFAGEDEALQAFPSIEGAGAWIDAARGRPAGTSAALANSVLTAPPVST